MKQWKTPEWNGTNELCIGECVLAKLHPQRDPVTKDKNGQWGITTTFTIIDLKFDSFDDAKWFAESLFKGNHD